MHGGGGEERLRKHKPTALHIPTSRDVQTSTSTKGFIGSGPGPRFDPAVMKAVVKFSYISMRTQTCFGLASNQALPLHAILLKCYMFAKEREPGTF